MVVLAATLVLGFFPKALIVYDTNASAPTPTALAAIPPLRRAGYEVETLSAGRLARLGKIEGQLVVLTRADAMPLSLGPVLDAFLGRRGHLIVFHGPAWRTGLVAEGGKWVGAQVAAVRRAGEKPTRVAIDFAQTDLRRWLRATNAPDRPSTFEATPTSMGFALHAKIGDLTSWDTLVSPALDEPFPNGLTATQFTAKGDARTRQLAVEWREKDGSRWIATVPLTTQWRRYRLSPKAFHYWPSVPSGESFDPANASQFSVGLAFSHTGSVGGAHEFWITNVGASPTADDEGVRIQPTYGLYPAYKFFEITEPVKVIGREDFASAGGYPSVHRSWSLQPRPRGVGYERTRSGRWIPLLEARSPAGEWRGIPGALTLWPNGTAVAGFGVDDDGFYRSPALLALVQRLANRLATGPWLLEGGSSAYTVFRDSTLDLGASVLDRRPAVVKFTAKPLSGGKVVWETVPMSGGSAHALWKPDWSKTNGYIITTDLLVGGKVVDRLAHKLYVYRPTAKNFVTARDGDFYLNGKVWRAHGVNYMPSSGIGLEENDDFEYWMDRRPYDPEVVERDLRKVQQLGFNAVSVFIYGRSVFAGNLLDFLRICRSLGLKVNLSLRPGTPLDFERDAVSSIILNYRLKDDDTVFAYDLAWEPGWGSHQDRRRWDGEWLKWIQTKYGSVEKAGWGIEAPTYSGTLTNPSDVQLSTDGPHRRMVADYRRFLDDLLAEKYGAARDYVRRIDPNHLVSFRMSEAGDPTNDGSGGQPYDFPGLAKSVDFLAPEGYGRTGDWERVKPGVFEVAYARSSNPSLPVVWAEAGMSILDPSRFEEDSSLAVQQATFYSAFYRMLQESRSNGVFWWWYPGGVRFNERSDYGIVNPDGTDRPVTKVIRREGPRFLSLGRFTAADTVLEYDRDADARGVYGVYERLKNAFWRRDGRVRLRSVTAP